ncbi:MAG: GDSL-type esterase/lipase family protein [Candidatus Poribacteria bacterium]|nr:GDSL-type esterase/lipase family protein [Candidatus Poribacteria bacterium]
MQLKPSDPRLTWQGTISVEHTDEYSQPWRIPYAKRPLFHSELALRAAMSAGVRIAFHSDTQSVSGKIVAQEGIKPIDCAVNGQVVSTVALTGQDTFRFDHLPSGKKLIELWLPQSGGEFRLKSLTLDDGASVEPREDTRPKWITYGSSITHCGEAKSPAYTWPGVVARGADLNLTCLGFGGQCHLDPMIARTIRDQEADIVSMCVGINIQGGGTLSPRTFQAAIIGTVQTIRDNHPNIPIVCMSPIYSPPREDKDNNVGFSLQKMRVHVAEAVEALKSCGDPNIHYVDGLDVFGKELNHLLPDQLHPNADGYIKMGENFLEKVVPRVL